jgi:hypothetical protein
VACAFEPPRTACDFGLRFATSTSMQHKHSHKHIAAYAQALPAPSRLSPRSVPGEQLATWAWLLPGESREGALPFMPRVCCRLQPPPPSGPHRCCHSEPTRQKRTGTYSPIALRSQPPSPRGECLAAGRFDWQFQTHYSTRPPESDRPRWNSVLTSGTACCALYAARRGIESDGGHVNQCTALITSPRTCLASPAQRAPIAGSIHFMARSLLLLPRGR